MKGQIPKLEVTLGTIESDYFRRPARSYLDPLIFFRDLLSAIRDYSENYPKTFKATLFNPLGNDKTLTSRDKVLLAVEVTRQLLQYSEDTKADGLDVKVERDFLQSDQGPYNWTNVRHIFDMYARSYNIPVSYSFKP